MKTAMYPRANCVRISLVAAIALTLASCGGGTTTTTNITTTNYTLGGTISGLTAGSVVLANGSDTVTVSAGATGWTFGSSFAAGTSYSVTVKTQPAGELCEVSDGSGVNTGDVGNVTVVCGYGQWVWASGVNAINATGVYGTLGTAAAGDVPGARSAASSWTDSSGNFWLFGGVGYDSAGAAGDLNDLWRYSPSTKEWTWISGGDVVNGSGVYGTPATAAAGNVPGARYSASSWIDSSGNLWLFGGVGYDAAGVVGNLNDLWRFSPTTKEWTWISGGNADNAAGVYGTRGTAAAGNVPGARYSASSWIDSSGNLWLFGGVGDDLSGAVGNLNDLWRFSPTTKEWTWINGGTASASSTICGNTLRAADSGPGYWGKAWPMPVPFTARWALPRPPTCQERARRPPPGSTLPATCGCSAELGTTRAAASATWTICGNTVRAPMSGPGSVAAAATMPQESTVPQAPPRWTARPEGAIRPAPGSIPPANCGCSAALATTQPATWATSMICGNTIRARAADRATLLLLIAEMTTGCLASVF
jgi:hypothetical protein